MKRIAAISLLIAASAFPAAAASARSAAGPKISKERIVLHTALGDMAFSLFPEIAPRHVAQIERLVKLGLYNTVHFYRVEPGFVVQLSDARDRLEPLSPEQESAIKPLKAEFSGIRHVRGILSMAREDKDPDSGTTSFSILLADAPHLDGKYTVFGRLERGEEVLDAIVAQPINNQHRPLDRIGIEKAEIVDAKKLESVMKPAPPRAAPRREETPSAWIYLVAAMMAVGFAVFFTAGKIPATATACLGMLNVLIGYFLLFLVLAPRARENSALSVAVFVGSIAVFKAMSYFERAR